MWVCVGCGWGADLAAEALHKVRAHQRLARARQLGAVRDQVDVRRADDDDLRAARHAEQQRVRETARVRDGAGGSAPKHLVDIAEEVTTCEAVESRALLIHSGSHLSATKTA